MTMSLDTTKFDIKPSGAALGADIDGVDLRRLDDDDFAAIEQAWHDHLVLRFRGQQLDDVQLMRFSARFGQLDRVPIRAADTEMTDDPRLSIAPEAREFVTVISNVKIGGKAIGGLGNYESRWHTDMSYNDEPPIASALYSIEVPPAGGDTGFSNMYRAYETLPAALQARIAGLHCIHDASRNSVGQLRRGFAEVGDPRQTVGAKHPIVRTHPRTGRKALFLGRRRNAYILGLELEESEALLAQLWTHATQAELTWTQMWRPGDLVIWDNRCTMHRRDEFDDNASRIMHRTQICGDRPY
jgi:alpha-ketoglutarate-dependent taurine dioxygenase